MNSLVGKRRRLTRPTAEGAHIGGRERAHGQSLVEFALVVPIIVFILLGVVDMARVFTSVLAIESAAREAADFGAFSSSRWIDDDSDGDPLTPTNYERTVQGMQERACVASSRLENYVGNRTSCTNPSVAISLVRDGGSPNTCDQPDRAQGPCWVQVDMAYDFDLIVPFGFDFFGRRLGLPDMLHVQRTSVFAVSDFSVDTEP